MSREEPDALVQQLEHELREALAIEPSPDFARRVRARIEQTSASRATWTVRWAAPLAAAAVCVLAIGIGWQVARDSGDRPEAPLANRTGTDVKLHPSPGQVAMPPPSRQPARSTARKVASSEPEIIVPPDRARALARLVELTRSGIVNEESLRPIAATLPPETLAVAPLVVTPITVPGIETGSRTAPGGATKSEEPQ